LGKSITYLSKLLRNNKISSVELVDYFFDRIERFDNKIHSFLSTDKNFAIKQAKESDNKIKNGDQSPLTGIPYMLKDNICTNNFPTTAGSKILNDFYSNYDATVVKKLNIEGAVLLGKGNLDEFAMGSSTENSSFGPTKNPWDYDYVPGGSSGGSGVSVSANECIASLGSDTGGSIRNPASFCSVVGLKPTYGLVSRYGLVSYANSIEQIGPMTKTVEDSAFLLNIISGIDSNDNTTIDNKNQDYLRDIDIGVSGKKIGIVTEMINSEGLSAEVANATNDAVKTFEKLGANCEQVSLQMVPYTVAAYYTITSTEAGSNLARYDNIRYGYELDSSGFEFNSYISQARSKFGPEVIRRMILGGFVPSAGHAGKYFSKALKVKSKLIAEIKHVFEKFDYLISPTVPIQPFKFGDKINDPVSFMMVDFNTVTANLTGIPAISVPYKITNGLPIGIQIMANHNEEHSLLQAAHALEKTVDLPEVPV